MALSTGLLISRPHSPFVLLPSSHSSSIPLRFRRAEFTTSIRFSPISHSESKVRFDGRCFLSQLRAVSEGEVDLVSEEEESSPSPPTEAEAEAEQTVSVSVSPSDILTMVFQAEGTMPDSAIPAVSTALEAVEGITDLKVQVQEGIASVELTKQTTVQATGVASNLVEIMQGSGFKLQTLNLSFEDEDDFSS
ncbi:uncharacterized protein LOC127254173 [Andrographis paniculata]|uniref:uncharacterized protein LOC127254173 n=1 Tax=Andrographis paniculata TaxID=175694 RepID=UPI0021E879F1|nr:uncharacterized protein LOC127254173 [Andrographis paniculata]